MVLVEKTPRGSGKERKGGNFHGIEKPQTAPKSNFGAKGWLMILVAGLMFYFYAGMCTDGLNTIVTNFANAHQVNEAALLSWTTRPAGWA